MGIKLKNSSEIDKMRRASMIVFEMHEMLTDIIKPGITTAYLDQEARIFCEKKKVKPAFLNYPSSQPGVPPFPGVLCTSVNEVIVHGIPNDTPLKEGDLLSVDFGCSVEGYFGDSARSHAIGNVSDEVKKLLEVTEESLERAISKCSQGFRIGDISNAVQSYVEKFSFGIVREFVGHGIGSKMHEPPHVPNFGRSGQGRPLKPGMVIAVEPMITAGSSSVEILEDGWTAVTQDGSMSAHFEHTIAITSKGPWVLSRP